MLTVSILFNNVLNPPDYPDTARIIEGTICFLADGIITYKFLDMQIKK